VHKGQTAWAGAADKSPAIAAAKDNNALFFIIVWANWLILRSRGADLLFKKLNYLIVADKAIRAGP
jgi:hypothetical protein